MDLASVADELYGLDPGDFTAVRDQRVAEARQAGDRETAAAVKRLRRPSSAAWAVNVLARERADEVERLAELGAALRDAQEQLAADELRALGRQRHRVVAGLVAEARTLANDRGHPLSDAVAREVEDTLDAALADPAAADTLRAGQLVRALQRSGFGGPDPGDAAPGAPAPTAAPAKNGGPDQAKRGAVEAARQEAERAEQAATDAEAALADAAQADDEAQQTSSAAAAEVTRLEAAIEEARRTAADAQTRARRTAEDRRDAKREADAARRRAEEAAEKAERASED